MSTSNSIEDLVDYIAENGRRRRAFRAWASVALLFFTAWFVVPEWLSAASDFWLALGVLTPGVLTAIAGLFVYDYIKYTNTNE
jgi:hypothetical protein